MFTSLVYLHITNRILLTTSSYSGGSTGGHITSQEGGRGRRKSKIEVKGRKFEGDDRDGGKWSCAGRGKMELRRESKKFKSEINEIINRKNKRNEIRRKKINRKD